MREVEWNASSAIVFHGARNANNKGEGNMNKRFDRGSFFIGGLVYFCGQCLLAGNLVPSYGTYHCCPVTDPAIVCNPFCI